MSNRSASEAAPGVRAIVAVVGAMLIAGSLLLTACGGDDRPSGLDASRMDGSGPADGSSGPSDGSASDDAGEATDADTPIDATVPPRDASGCLGVFGASIFGTACFGD